MAKALVLALLMTAASDGRAWGAPLADAAKAPPPASPSAVPPAATTAPPAAISKPTSPPPLGGPAVAAPTPPVPPAATPGKAPPAVTTKAAVPSTGSSASAGNATAEPGGASAGRSVDKAIDKAIDKTADKTSEHKAAAKLGDAQEAAGPRRAASDQGPPPEGKAPVRAKARPRAIAATPGAAEPKVGEGPSPASPPPLTIGGLRDEARQKGVGDGGAVAINPSAPARTKLEQMLEEITKTRASLRDDTARLEAMLLPDGDSQSPTAAAATPGAPGAAKPAKNPLDVLAKALRGIKPEQAAPIVSRLDKRLAATVLQRMPPVDAGKILGAMKPDTAAELATQIALKPISGASRPSGVQPSGAQQ